MITLLFALTVSASPSPVFPLSHVIDLSGITREANPESALQFTAIPVGDVYSENVKTSKYQEDVDVRDGAVSALSAPLDRDVLVFDTRPLDVQSDIVTLLFFCVATELIVTTYPFGGCCW